MVRILIDVAVDEFKLGELHKRKDVSLEVIPFEESPRALPGELIENVEVLFCSFPPTNSDAMRKLRWIQVGSSGYSQLFAHRLADRHIRATNARGCFDVPIAEWNIAMMLNLLRDLPRMLRNQQAHVWDRSARFQRELRGLTVGLWGYGGLARETARLAKSLGMHVHVLTRNGVRPAPQVYRIEETGDPDGSLPERVYLAGGEQEFLRELDFLIVAMPLTHRTEGIVGERELRWLPRSAYLLNPARGPLVQESALLQALTKGWITGAAIDTHYQYPMPSGHALWDLPNVILTPHIAGSTLNPMFRSRLWDIFAQNVDRYISGMSLLNELTLEQLRGE